MLPNISSTDIVTNDTNDNVTFPPALLTIYAQLPRSMPLVVLQSIIYLFGSASNVLVLFVLLRRRNPTQLVTQLFVASLAVADLGLMFGVGWIQAVLYFRRVWKFDHLWCKMYYFLMGWTIGCSTWTLAALAADRFDVRVI